MKHTMKKELIAAEDAYEATRFNALRHGVLSRYTVLPWEDAEEYSVVLAGLVAEHSPQGPTEEHLVEELAGIIWRKRRLRLAEATTHRHGFGEELVHAAAAGKDVIDAILTTPANTELEIAAVEEGEQKAKQSLRILLSGRKDAYEAAAKELCAHPQEWWAYMLEILDTVGTDPFEPKKTPPNSTVGENPPNSAVDTDETPPTSNKNKDETFAVILRWFLETIVLPWFEERKNKLANRRSIREYAWGLAVNPDKVEKLDRHEVHLDRKFERTLSTLLRLKELRRSTDNA